MCTHALNSISLCIIFIFLFVSMFFFPLQKVIITIYAFFFTMCIVFNNLFLSGRKWYIDALWKMAKDKIKQLCNLLHSLFPLMVFYFEMHKFYVLLNCLGEWANKQQQRKKGDTRNVNMMIKLFRRVNYTRIHSNLPFLLEILRLFRFFFCLSAISIVLILFMRVRVCYAFTKHFSVTNNWSGYPFFFSPFKYQLKIVATNFISVFLWHGYAD